MAKKVFSKKMVVLGFAALIGILLYFFLGINRRDGFYVGSGTNAQKVISADDANANKKAATVNMNAIKAASNASKSGTFTLVD